MNGVESASVLSVAQSAPGIYQVGFLLSASELTEMRTSPVVYFNGRDRTAIR